MLFRILSFLGAFLLFALEPMIGKAALPFFGGGAEVWLACLLFFQVVLLSGYGYAHAVTALGMVQLRRLHGALLGLAVLLAASSGLWGGAPFLPGPGLPGAGIQPPPIAILVQLSLCSGLGLLVLSTTSPLVQTLYLQHHGGREPYHLYAISNWGSFAGLLTYPFLLEPMLGLRAQAWLAFLGFLVYGGLCFSLLWSTPIESEAPKLADDTQRPEHSVSNRLAFLKWVGLSALGTVWLLAVSGKLSTDVASIPLLWIPPLALYLLTFVLAFGPAGKRLGATCLVPAITFLAAYAGYMALPMLLNALVPGLRSQDAGVASFLLRMLQGVSGKPLYSVLISLGALFSACLLAHMRLADLRPQPARLTAYFLAISVGGALGGVLVSIVAPLMFDQNYELPIALAIVAGVTLWRSRHQGDHGDRVGLGFSTVALSMSLVAILGSWTDGSQLHFRDFFGTIRVYQPHKNLVQMAHGNTIHGIQFVKEPLRPAAYFGLDSGLGKAMRTLQHERASLQVGIIGLGVGNAIGYGRKGDHFTVYEISPKIIQLSGTRGTIFKVASSTPASVEIKEGDGRILLNRDVAQGRRFDLLMVDAFAGGSIPVHLLTVEALRLYLASLNPEGILVLHVTHNLPLERQVGIGLDALDVPAVEVRCPATYGRDQQGSLLMVEMPSVYWLVSASPRMIFRDDILRQSVGLLKSDKVVQSVPPAAMSLVPDMHSNYKFFKPWTDDRSSIVDLLH